MTARATGFMNFGKIWGMLRHLGWALGLIHPPPSHSPTLTVAGLCEAGPGSQTPARASQKSESHCRYRRTKFRVIVMLRLVAQIAVPARAKFSPRGPRTPRIMLMR